ncbi:MAG: peptide chain release factor N(5)-glutamine methyltransferase [Clostridia bacterium]|nr:peptide chain release factor N(5)-glutamine methyltransferase [Clostridia bacterium]
MRLFGQPPAAGEALQQAVLFLQENGIPQARLEAEVLLSHVLGLSRAGLLARLDQSLTGETRAKFFRLVRQRGEGEPLQYLTGRQEFMSLELKVSPAVLIPRGETELLVEKVLDLRQDLESRKRIRIVDVGTGSGAIAVSLAYYWPGAEVYAVDISPEALALARQNALSHRVEVIFLQSDLLEAFLHQGKKFEIIVSNPPYIPTPLLPSLPREVGREPVTALDGGLDGLSCYRRLIPQAASLLAPGGFLALEIGWDQGIRIREILQKEGFSQISLFQDYGGRDRIILAR